jgi:hypothetical protein
MMVTRTALAASAVIEIAAYIFQVRLRLREVPPVLLAALLLWVPVLRARDPPLTGPLIAQTSEDHQDWVNTATDLELR